MEDNEKNRIEYVNRIEQQLIHLQSEHNRYKAIAEKWEPKFTVQNDLDNKKVLFGLQYAGKYVHATLSHQYLTEVDLTSGVSTVLEALINSLVTEQLKAVMTPEFDKVQKSVKAIQGAGKW